MASLVVVGAITALALLLRISALDESLFGDELFTYVISTRESLSDVLAGVQSDLEISPPLFFVLTWLAHLLGDSFVWLRIVSLVAGVATIPLIFLLGDRTVGRVPATIGAGFFAVSPMAVFFATEARSYALTTFLVVLSTLVMLKALDSRDWRWFALLAFTYAAAMYSHYTSAFVLAVQAAWAGWTHRDQIKSLAIAMACAVLLFGPWIPSLVADSDAPARSVNGLFRPFGPGLAAEQISRLVMGGPFARLVDLPGAPAFVFMALALVAGIIGVIHRVWVTKRFVLPQRTTLIVLLAFAAPAGAALLSLLSNDMFQARNLISSLPAIYLMIAALLAALPRVASVAAVTAAALALLIAVSGTFRAENQRPAFAQAAAFIEAEMRPGDVVYESSLVETPPNRALALHLDPGIPVFRTSTPESAEAVAVAAQGQEIFVVRYDWTPEEARPQVPAGYRRVATRSWPGLWSITVEQYEPRR